MAKDSSIKFVVSPKIDVVMRKKYCRFIRNNIRYLDYKDPVFLTKFLNEQGKLMPRRFTGNSLKWQRRVAQAIKRARHLAFLPYVTDNLK